MKKILYTHEIVSRNHWAHFKCRWGEISSFFVVYVVSQYFLHSNSLQDWQRLSLFNKKIAFNLDVLSPILFGIIWRIYRKSWISVLHNLFYIVSRNTEGGRHLLALFTTYLLLTKCYYSISSIWFNFFTSPILEESWEAAFHILHICELSSFIGDQVLWGDGYNRVVRSSVVSPKDVCYLSTNLYANLSSSTFDVG